ncbi:hypothetical protein AOQ84DRAFT_353236 [Glonium stellatum]|uniref:GCN5-related N-acetyltransferase Rv2170-like domain-containing protein n=1 Tax=Glonium stellatum TaxID=574774 RepID=A0A8E2F5M5_9PEZI|nr:hypothetical protein AOQ84DRAFT_353236 [Glonium stellatum]
MPPAPSLKVYEHSASSPNLLHALQSCLPHSLPLYRSIQSHDRSPDAHILATLPPEEDGNQNGTQGGSTIPNCFAAAFVDRSLRPQTEMWAFVSGEMPDHQPENRQSASVAALVTEEAEVKASQIREAPSPLNNTPILVNGFIPNSSSNAKLSCPSCTSAFISLLKYIAVLPDVPLLPENEKYLEMAVANATAARDLGVRHQPINSAPYLAHLLVPTVLTVGTLHSSLTSILTALNLVRTEFPGLEAPCQKFIFRISDLNAPVSLPEGLRWGTIRAPDLKIVQARTAIPRTDRSLLSYKSVGIFEKDTDAPIAWAFLSSDGSLTSLHVEPAFRNRGLAKAVATKLFREHPPNSVSADGDGDWAHADVFEGNLQSDAVCKSIGGKKWWTVFWVRLDLGRVRTVENEI